MKECLTILTEPLLQTKWLNLKLLQTRTIYHILYIFRFLGNRQVDSHQSLVTGIHYISRRFFFQNFKFAIFYDFFFVFVNIGPYGSKNFKWHLHWKYAPDSPPKHHAHSWEGSLPKLFKELRNLTFWIFDKYFSFSLTCDHMGINVSNDISSERAHQNFWQFFLFFFAV